MWYIHRFTNNNQLMAIIIFDTWLTQQHAQSWLTAFSSKFTSNDRDYRHYWNHHIYNLLTLIWVTSWCTYAQIYVSQLLRCASPKSIWGHVLGGCRVRVNFQNYSRILQSQNCTLSGNDPQIGFSSTVSSRLLTNICKSSFLVMEEEA